MKAKTTFFCSDCGWETPKWAGRCSSCGAWNTLVEAPAEQKAKGGAASRTSFRGGAPEPLSEIDSSDELRFTTGLGEFDRVLGGGAVRGSLVLVGGAPGIGKSTLLLQLCGLVSGEEKILYVTGEESRRQLKMRADRLGVEGGNVFILAETALEECLSAAESIKPDILIIDSIQTLYNSELTAGPGSVTQVKDCTTALMRLSKAETMTTFIVGHVNKDGAIAGPKVLEHMVDCVLYFEGEGSASYRILRAAKNRFGSTNEIGVFEMLESGLAEVANPSEMLLSGRPESCPGTCVTCVIEGTRPILAEVQALVAKSGFGQPRRNANGVDYNRAALLIAVLEKRGGLTMSACDAYINVIGGLTLDEPAADLATVLALASSFCDVPIGDDLAAVGEIGLTGEIRSVSGLNQRLAEIGRLGFRRCVIPAHVRADVRAPESLELIRVKNVRQAIKAVLG
ncbi:MAG: DNA repair protein RadA [Oscillospiraceae bacterium]|jgi:DNA repair protein RadA/Sms|nr:DNA repair protein RadA [Oscillospiraceae bacterium]